MGKFVKIMALLHSGHLVSTYDSRQLGAIEKKNPIEGSGSKNIMISIIIYLTSLINVIMRL